MKSFSRRVAVVTGAGSGIGRALARALARERMTVLALDVDVFGIVETAAIIASEGGVAQVRKADVCDSTAMSECADFAYSLGEVAVLCNNAGVGTAPGRTIWDTPDSDWAWILDVNVMGVVNGIRAFVPRMIAANHSAHIVNTASMAGLYAPPFLGPYVASKHAIVGLSEQLFRELRIVDAPIGVSVLCPLFVDTRILDSERSRPAKYATDSAPVDSALVAQVRASLASGQSPDEVASLVIEGIAEKRFMILCDEASRAMARERLSIIEGRLPVEDQTIARENSGIDLLKREGMRA